ncbi:MAG: dihydroxyacetone kinase subunit DhaK, partial [Oscillospiraceae bacterium]|nr:dihydroxyacetone kinase subunit DhaK [Oscillospiraceae bacterium]
MKKVINDPKNVVDEMLKGMTFAYPDHVKRVEGFDVIVRANKKSSKVALVSGGGSGHEPSHA